MSLDRSCTKLLKLCNTFLQKICSAQKNFPRCACRRTCFDAFRRAKSIVCALARAINRVKSSFRRQIDRSVALRAVEIQIAIAPTARSWPDRRSSTAMTRGIASGSFVARHAASNVGPCVALDAPLEMNRIEAVPRRRHWNYRYFSRLADRDEPFVDFANEHASRRPT